MKIAELRYLPRESRWFLVDQPELHMTDFESASCITHPETGKVLVDVGDPLDSMLVSSLVEDGVDEILIRHFTGGARIHCVVYEVAHA